MPSSSDFLAENNLCGQSILKLVSTGNAILADLLRLKDTVPSVFRLDNKADELKYGELLVDFSYFACSETFERKVEKSQVLTDLDQEIRENYMEILSQFYFLFESIQKYVTELNRFVDDVDGGYYIQMTLESILYDKEGKQLLTESLFLYGVMLLLADLHIDGLVRERMLTSFYRYAGAFQTEIHIDEVCKLFRSTGYNGKSKKPVGYPLDYFKRVPLDNTFVQMIIGVLRSDDIYLQVGSAYPLPEHRSTAFAVQASMLVVTLYFHPTMLNSDNASMREITDKFFPDNWVVPVYMGYFINLMDHWDSFKAAKLALANTIEITKVKQISSEKGGKMEALTIEAEKLLHEGLLTEENILEKMSSVINLLRDCNATLRWVILQCTSLLPTDGHKKMKQLRDLIIIESKYSEEAVLKFLLCVAQLETKVRDLFNKLLSEKQIRWTTYKQEAIERITELAEVFAGTKPLSRIEKNENLHKWLDGKAVQVQALNFEELSFSGRKLVELIRAFDEMLEFHGLDSKVQVREWVTEILACFHKMLRTGSTNENQLVTLQLVADLGYAWGPIIDQYTIHMQRLIHKDPVAVSKLRAVFLKLSTSLDFPLMRIGQAKSNQLLATVSSYYSEELVAYVQKVLQIIPESVLSILHKIIELQTNKIDELPTRLNKEKVRDYAQLESRYKVAQLTYEMSTLAEGILMMQTTLVGIIKIQPRRLLENGIRKELVRQVCNILHDTLTFQNKPGSARETEFMAKLKSISTKFDGIRRSFEYIGDYISCNGLKVFHEEFARVLNFFTEQECNGFSKSKVLSFQSFYQSKEVPIPSNLVSLSTATVGEYSPLTFLGRMANELLALTEVKTSIYLTSTCTWYDLKSHLTLLSPECFSTMEKALGITGMAGLDKILSFMIAERIELLIKVGRQEADEKQRDFITSLEKQLTPTSSIIENPVKKYSTWYSKIAKTPAIDVVKSLQRMGQLQLLRRRIQYQLKASATMQAKQLHKTVHVLNKLMVECHMLDTHKDRSSEDISSVSTFHPVEVSNLSFETLNHSETLGLYDPYAQIYITMEPVVNISLYISLLLTNELRKLTYSRNLSSLTCRKITDPADGIPLVIGISTLFYQMNPSHTFGLLSYLCQFLNSIVVQLSVTPGGTAQQGEMQELGAVYYFLITLLDVHPRKEDVTEWINEFIPCFRIIPNIINKL